jgi:sporulation protein YlmC with PRC-barrel domain
MRFNMTTIATLVSAIGLSAAMAAHAQDAADRAPASPGATAAQQQNDELRAGARNARASQLIGMEVRNAQGENLGEINDLVVDVNNERVHYAILAFGGFMGMGEKLFAYPVRVFSVGRDGEALVLNVEKERLKQAPGFERDRWPDWTAEEGYRGEVDRYYGPTVQLEPRPNMLLRRASELLDADVTAAAGGDDIGDVDDMVVDISNGQVQYVVVDLEDGWGQSDRLTLLPLRAFRHGGQDEDDLALRLNQQQVASAPGFQQNRWPDLDRDYRSELQAWFDNFGMDDTARAGSDNGNTR